MRALFTNMLQLPSTVIEDLATTTRPIFQGFAPFGLFILAIVLVAYVMPEVVSWFVGLAREQMWRAWRTKTLKWIETQPLEERQWYEAELEKRQIKHYGTAGTKQAKHLPFKEP